MEKAVRKNYMNDLELQSLHYWFKNVPPQDSPHKYNNVLKIMQDTIYKGDILDTMNANTQEFANLIQIPHINFYQRIILRNVFEHWKIYVVHKLHTRRARYKANYFYHKKLQKKVLNILSENVLLKWQHIVSSMNIYVDMAIFFEKNDEVEEHYSKVMLKRYFRYWCNYILIIHKKKEQSEKASIFYNIYCLKKFTTNWKIYLTSQREKKLMREKADQARELYIKNILRKFIAAWISVCEFTLQKDMIRCAIMHYEAKILLKYFYLWKEYHMYKEEKLNIAAHILTHNRKRLLKTYFRQFIAFVNESINERIANEQAEVLYIFKLMQKVFLAWRKWYNEVLDRAAKLCKIRSIFENGLKRTILSKWRLYVIQKKCKRRKSFTARNFYNRNLSIKCLRQFHNYVLYRKEKKVNLSYINDKSEEIIKQLQIIYIDKWRRTLYCAMQEKQKVSQVIEFWELNLTRKYFAKWKEFSQQYKTKVIRKMKLNEIATGFLLKKYILHWYSKLQDVLIVQEKEIFATSMMKRKVMKKCFSSWKEYIVQKIRMNNDIKAAVEMHKQFLLREGLKEILRNSLRSINYQHDVQLETAANRSYKNYEILKEYFDKWHSLIYMENKSEHTYKAPNSNDSQSKQAPLNNFQTCLVLPEYMIEKNKMRNGYSSLAMFPQDWSSNIFSPL